MSNIGNILTGVLGMGPVLGTQIHRLRKNRGEMDRLAEMQAGRGAGAQLARNATADAARTAAGVAQGGQTQLGGLNVLTGLRAAEDVTARGVGTSSAVAAREAARATRLRHASELARRNQIGQLGAAMGGGVAQLIAQNLAGKDVAPENAPAVRETGASPEMQKTIADLPLPNVSLGRNPFDEQDAQVAEDVAAAQETEPTAQPAAAPAPEAAQPAGGAPAEAQQMGQQMVEGIQQAFNQPAFQALLAAGYTRQQALELMAPQAGFSLTPPGELGLR